MRDGEVEETRYPRNPLDVLSQQLVALCSLDEWTVEDLFGLVRRAAPYAGLTSPVFEGVLDLLSGRYPSDDLSDLRPRLFWDRVRGRVRAREGARRVAVVNAGTIPDRGLYGVYLLGGREGAAPSRLGELDEEMVFESKVSDTFTLGASTWRIEEITNDRVLVSAAPGEPGRMPFWKGDAPGRPLELGRRIGRLARELGGMEKEAALARLLGRHGLDPKAAENLFRFLSDQREATGVVPDDRTVVVERCQDEMGDWRVCLLSPFGVPVLLPWCLAATSLLGDRLGIDPESLFTNDGFALRLPDAGGPPDVSFLFPGPEEVEALVRGQLSKTPLFAGRFREAPAVPCSCRAAGPGGARRSGSSASAPRTCWRSPPASRIFPSFSRRTASAFTTPSISRRSRSCSLCSAAARCAPWWSTLAPRPPSPPRCSSAGWRASSTMATRPWRSGGRRRSPSTPCS